MNPYAAMSEIAPSSSRSFGPVREAMRPETGESTIITSPAGITIEARGEQRQPEAGAGRDRQLEHLREDDVRREQREAHRRPTRGS